MMIPVIAKFKMGDHDIEAPVMNPNGEWGEAWVAQISIANALNPFFVIEGKDEAEAIDVWADDDKYGHLIVINVEDDGDDYGESISGLSFDDLSEEQQNAVEVLRGKGIDDSDIILTLSGKIVESGCIATPVSTSSGWVDLDRVMIYPQKATPGVMYHANGLPEEGVTPKDFSENWEEMEGDLYANIQPYYVCKQAKRNYENGVCPDCGETIPDDAETGDDCENCDHVF